MPLRYVAPNRENPKTLRETAACEMSFHPNQHTQVAEAFRAQPRIADFLYCSAGGNHAENGFFIDLKATQLDSCMKNNYYSTAYAAKAMLDIWVESDKKPTGIDMSNNATGPKTRKIVFVNSAAAFLGLPGSVAYTRKSMILILLSRVCCHLSG
jgi:NAD(P)-dependent dehydrogenase (short-subunit alcohol dehydrogenase family)